MTRSMQRLVFVVVCLLSVSGAGLATADEREDGKKGKAKKQLAASITSAPAKPTLQTPYGLDKDDRKTTQGNRGRPIMAEPYGHDKDEEDDEDEQGRSRGRPFRPVARLTAERPGSAEPEPDGQQR